MAIDPNNLAGTAKLTFSDEFNSLSLWNGSSGTWNRTEAWDNARSYTLQGNGEEQWYVNSSYAATSAVKPWSVNNGVLSITAQETPDNLKPLLDNLDYTSGQINTYHSFAQQYGYFEISAKLPSGSGLWPAFWLLPEDRSWPPEIDIMENLGQNTNAYYTTVHSNASGGHTMEGNGIDTGDLSASFHRYGVDWQSDKITWYLDGKEVFQADTPADLHSPMYMIANLAVGGYWPGSPGDDTRFPESYDIDYIRAYAAASNGETAPVTSAPVQSDPTPDAAASNGQSGANDPPAAQTPTQENAAPQAPVQENAPATPSVEHAHAPDEAPTPVAESQGEAPASVDASPAPAPVTETAAPAPAPAPVTETAAPAPIDSAPEASPQPVAEASPAPAPAFDSPPTAGEMPDRFDFSQFSHNFSKFGGHDTHGLMRSLADLFDNLGDFTQNGAESASAGGGRGCQSFAIHYNADSGFHFAENAQSHHHHSWDHLV